MSELAVQSSNSTYSSDQRSYLDQEFQQLKQEIIRVSEMHEWNGFPILNGKAGLPVGTPKLETVDRAAVSSTTPGGKVLNEGDLKVLIGKDEFYIPASSSSDDTKSSLVAASSSAAGSAIAVAAAINKKLALTGVSASANGAEIAGAKTTVSTKSIQTDLYINGTKVNLSLTSGQTESQRRAYVMNSINAQTAQHGVIAGDPGNGGLKLTTVDGRNLSVWYDGSVAIGSDFGLGMNTATTSDPEGVTGVASAAVAAATGTGAVKAATVYGTITLNSDKEFTINPGANSYPTSITGINGNQYVFPAVDATNNPSTDVISVNYGGKTGTYTVGAAATTTAANFKDAVNTLAGSTVAYVGFTNNGATTSASTALTPSSMAGLVVGMSVEGTGIPAGTRITAVNASTVTLSNAATATGAAVSFTYAGGTTAVQIIADSAASPTLTVTAPKEGSKPTATTITGSPSVTGTAQVAAKDPTYSNLSALGFVPGAVMAKNIGRLNFQVGPAANQLISIDLADFGKNGDITGPITSDKAPTNLLTVQSANDVIMNVNKSLDRIAATRATMGAVMNRLTHVIDNLTNVVMNSESSRSQIEDADYAKASTELARTQIMQQAATAVLAQANTSQQTVLKLLQG
jgi:flagellin